jgi:hypothetical protein
MPRRICDLLSRIALIWLCMALASRILAEAPPQCIQFARGRSMAILKGAVLRGERARYLLRARAGQSIMVRVTSVEGNAVFSLYPPGRSRPLPGTEENADATHWTGTLPRSGDYRLQIGATRGNATYDLRVTVRTPRRPHRPTRPVRR